MGLKIDAWTIELKRTPQEATLLLEGRPFGLRMKITVMELEQLAAQLTQEAMVWRRERNTIHVDYYTVLGVSRDATVDEIQAAYRTLAKQYHPDTSSSETGAAMTQINEAYETLSDDHTRRIYDATFTTMKGD